MKKIFLLAIFGVSIFAAYKYFAPALISNYIIAEEEPAYLPKYIASRLRQYRQPINKGATEIIRTLHDRDIEAEQLFEAIDNITENDINAVANDIKTKKPKSNDELFDIIKDNLDTEFDLEALREPFTQNVDINLINKASRYSRSDSTEALIDPLLVKRVVKNILQEKEREYQAKHSN